jgi:hypothetical protein
MSMSNLIGININIMVMKRRMLICLFIIIMLVSKENEWNSLHFLDFVFLEQCLTSLHLFIYVIKKRKWKFTPLNKNEKLHKMFLQNLYDLFIHKFRNIRNIVNKWQVYNLQLLIGSFFLNHKLTKKIGIFLKFS